MPSRLGVGFILLFWLAATAHVGYQEVWPRLFSDGPPPLRIDLADEATQALPTNWDVYRGDQRIGKLATRMQNVPEDDTFRFVNTYSNLSIEQPLPTGVTVVLDVPRAETVVRVTRSGDLREQRMSGDLTAAVRTKLGVVKLGTATAEVTGVVQGGQLVGRCKITSPLGNIDRPLDPVPVPQGQVLNPMMPVGRLRDVQPGRRWMIREVNPLRDAVNLLIKEVLKSSEVAAGAIPQPRSQELIAEVRSPPERLERPDREPVECWVIEYRNEEVQARTWVSVSDGRVLRQEASGFGERLRFERQD
jgi:hypothetical protein